MPRKRNALMIAVVPAALLTASCAHVSQQDLDTQLGTLRDGLEQRMDEGDARLATRLDGVEGRLTELGTDLDAMERDFGVAIEELETSLRFDVPVYFEFDKADVTAPAREILARFGSVAEKYYPDARITVEGFTDPAGSASYNIRLGQRRADSVKSYLVAQGMEARRIRTVSYGESTDRLIMPGARGPGTTGWENRRVVLVIDHDGSAAAPPIAEEGSR